MTSGRPGKYGYDYESEWHLRGVDRFWRDGMFGSWKRIYTLGVTKMAI